MRKDSEGFHSHTVPWGSGQAAPEMNHVAGLGKLSQVFPGSEDRKDSSGKEWHAQSMAARERPERSGQWLADSCGWRSGYLGR